MTASVLLGLVEAQWCLLSPLTVTGSPHHPYVYNGINSRNYKESYASGVELVCFLCRRRVMMLLMAVVVWNHKRSLRLTYVSCFVLILLSCTASRRSWSRMYISRTCVRPKRFISYNCIRFHSLVSPAWRNLLVQSLSVWFVNFSIHLLVNFVS